MVSPVIVNKDNDVDELTSSDPRLYTRRDYYGKTLLNNMMGTKVKKPFDAGQRQGVVTADANRFSFRAVRL